MSKRLNKLQEALRQVVSDVPEEGLSAHPNPSNKCKFVPIPATGVRVKLNTLSLSSPSEVNVFEGSLVVYTEDTSESGGSRIEFMARVLALAIQDGAGAVIDPPSFATFTLSTDMCSAYLRLVPANSLYAVIDTPELLKWFVSQEDDFSADTLPLLIAAQDHGSLNVRYIHEMHDAKGNLQPPHSMPYYVSMFVRHFSRQFGVQPVWIIKASWDFELWLHQRSYRTSGVGILAADMLRVYLQQHPVSDLIESQMKSHAERIGHVVKTE